MLGVPTKTRASVVWCWGSQPKHASNPVYTGFATFYSLFYPCLFIVLIIVQIPEAATHCRNRCPTPHGLPRTGALSCHTYVCTYRIMLTLPHLRTIPTTARPPPHLLCHTYFTIPTLLRLLTPPHGIPRTCDLPQLTIPTFASTLHVPCYLAAWSATRV